MKYDVYLAPSLFKDGGLEELSPYFGLRPFSSQGKLEAIADSALVLADITGAEVETIAEVGYARLNHVSVVTGADMDVIAEIGYAFAKQVPVVTYSWGDSALSAMLSERIICHCPLSKDEDVLEMMKKVAEICNQISGGATIAVLRERYFTPSDEVM